MPALEVQVSTISSSHALPANCPASSSGLQQTSRARSMSPQSPKVHSMSPKFSEGIEDELLQIPLAVFSKGSKDELPHVSMRGSSKGSSASTAVLLSKVPMRVPVSRTPLWLPVS
ncbi:hypothetical protein CRENBAI_005223 [Crenichthys baileyi]|uniref:Uncharacterized protein n=1 Tax=Crenichthys baileyi TaxID=28760 RepID=A0AAV9S5G4_9TELE